LRWVIFGKPSCFASFVKIGVNSWLNFLHFFMPSLSYSEFAQRVYATGVLSDPWLGGRERFRLEPVIISADELHEFYTVAERVALIYHELAEIVWQQPELLDEFFALTPFQKVMWLASEGRWHGIARVDLFRCTDGQIRACEMNSDTPSGEAEAVLLNQMLHEFHPHTIDPNADFAERFWQMLQTAWQSIPPSTSSPTHPFTNHQVAILYPTDMPEDLSMIALYRQWLTERGCEVVLGSPYNLGIDAQGRVTVMGQAVDIIVRHYKTDWWGEREIIWKNQQPYADEEPLARELLPLLESERAGRVAVVNPFGAVVTQNKHTMALMWERQELFSAQAQAWIRAHIPETRRMVGTHANDVPRKGWVLKSVYGCEGDSVVIGAFVKPKDWFLSLTAIIERHWIAQRFFEVAPLAETNLLPNFGVYLLGGRAAAIFTRLSQKATDYSAVTAPTYVVD
jgi:glutathionylspermidine synthase